ncbi:cyclohexanecarboxylate-CoA ligase [Alsobacter soli]|uniref:3-methylmercaptopropionyl-CoA ligase n=1 Tax=Alsobacter soli TaxID=2109933 RepID=A0A2T1HMU1_9HYPH|nr:AMP-binding protein [Alsobacter soli]PSC02901.1 cyclohexanecarboxylate-CoA ligase [Alsobacter soli]
MTTSLAPDASPPPAWRRRLESRRAEYRASDAWSGDTIARLALRRCAEGPDRVALIDGDRRVTFGRLVDEAARLAAWLEKAGLRPGDVVSYQLPNWYEAAVLNLAAAMAGLVVNPLVPIYRDAEVGYMLADCRSKALFTPQRFRSYDYLDMVRRLRPTLPDLLRVVVVRGEAGEFDAFETAVAGPPMPPESFASDANAIKLILYTSGTTGRAKGVLHTHATIMAAMRTFGDFWSVTPQDCVFMASPVSHITGYLYALEQPFVLSTPAVLMDVWQPDTAAELIRTHGCTIAFGATPFLNELAASVERSGRPLPSLRLFPCGGAPVPPEVAYRAQRALAPCVVCRIYGATEVSGPIAFGARNGDARLAAETDGEIFNADVRIVDPRTGQDVAPGQEGEILLRGPQTFVGYLDPRDDEAAFDGRDFFRTGDLGKIDPPGYIVTTGRSKDLIIRGGENLSPREIEDKLLEHPAVQEAAVVGMPDERLGEAVCAYVTCRPEGRIDQAEAARFLVERHLAKQKIPIRLEVVEELPKTPTGKVRKDILRQRAAGGSPS